MPVVSFYAVSIEKRVICPYNIQKQAGGGNLSDYYIFSRSVCCVLFNHPPGWH